MNPLSDITQATPKLAAFARSVEEGASLLVEGLSNSSKALLAALAQAATGKQILLITAGNQEENRLFLDLAFFTKQPLIDFPSWETLPSENIAPSPDIVGERYRALRQILETKTPALIIANLHACLQKLVRPAIFQENSLSLMAGKSPAFEKLIEKLIHMGYERKTLAVDKGEFAVRGGIIDIFPVSSPDPFRLEFWGDELESLRIFDPIGQKSIRPVTSVEIPPALELEMLKKEALQASLLDYLGENTLIIFDDLLSLEDRYAALMSLGESHPFFLSIQEFLERLAPFQKIMFTKERIEDLSAVSLLPGKGALFYSHLEFFHDIAFELFQKKWQVTRFRHPFRSLSQALIEEETASGEELLSALCSLKASAEIHFLCSSESEERSLQERLMDQKAALPKKTLYHIGYLSCGFAIEESEILFFPTTELTKRYKIRRQKLRSTYHTPPIEAFELKSGDAVVHVGNGIGKFLGVEKKPNHLGILSEFFTIEYAEQAKLYVPLNQAHLLTKYIGAHEETPKLSTLGSSKWKKTKEQTERAILNYASDLLKSYAERALSPGFAYSEDGPELLAFEEEFPFVETEDQLLAIASIKQDMQSQKAMDRLVCGDVGYGKTEVAMRAAFKAVVDGKKQVAVLVPTTVLAMQHFETFAERMANFPINVSVLSRFRTPKQIKETLEGLKKGSIDIVVGTHRVIGQDVVFKDLGLVIIDEEQRFGVKAKEHLKKIKTGVDCLTLSATPIPRTLYMSLIGARDLSTINTPPQDRLPIKSVIAENKDTVIQTALLRELSREGQAFFIHNRVETIYSVFDRIKRLLPQARLTIAHGQMTSDEIDAAFHAFKSGQADILIATTIVENGIDIPNANTILIDKADHFGLSTLYQMQGRVGRWNRRAYAYFLVSNLSSLPEVSRKRLEVLTEASGYGGGMKIAMRDLEIRGAGDILGLEQSGHVSSIGFHLYCKMLKKTILTMQGKIPSAVSEVKMEFSIDARLPENYVNEVSLRMELYQRLGEAFSLEEVDGIWAEIQDRFGPPPSPAKWLYHLTRIRTVASRKGITLIKQEKLSLIIEKKSGKEMASKRVLAPKYKTPEEFEQAIVAKL